ncbi:hypothetical protein STENM223S_11839 [Streptomyces tendae]
MRIQAVLFVGFDPLDAVAPVLATALPQRFGPPQEEEDIPS